MSDFAPNRRTFLGTAALFAYGGGSATGATVLDPRPPLAPEPPLPPGVFHRLGSARFRGRDGFSALRFSHDGRRLVNEAEDHVYEVWDVESAAAIPFPWRTKKDPLDARMATASHLLTSNDGTKRLEVNEDRFEVRDAASNRVLAEVVLPPKKPEFRHQLHVYTVSNDGRWVAGEYFRSSGKDPERYGQRKVLWDTAAGRVAHEFEFSINCHEAIADTYFRFSNDCRTLFAMEYDNDRPSRLVVLDVATGNVKRRYANALGEQFAVSPDERTAVVYSSHALRVIDLESGRVLRQSQDPLGTPWRVWFGAGGRVLAELTDDLGQADYGQDHRTWVAWDSPDKPTRPVPHLTAFPPEEKKPGDRAWLDGRPIFSLSPTAERYAAVGEYRTLIRDAGTHRIRHTIRFPRPKLEGGVFIIGGIPPVSHSHAWTPDGRTFVLNAHGHLVSLDTETGRRRSVRLPTGLWLNSLRVSTDGRTAGGVWKQDAPNEAKPRAEVVTVTLSTGKIARTPLQYPRECQRHWLTEFWLSGDLRRVLCQFEVTNWDAENDEPRSYSMRVVDTRTRRRVVEWPSADTVQQAGISPDGRTVFLAATRVDNGCRTLELALEAREVATGERRWRVPLTSGCRSLDISADGRTLLTAHADAPVFLWDVFGEKSAPQPFPTAKQLAEVWAELASDGETAFRAMRVLVQHPAAAVELLTEKLKPAEAPPDDWVSTRIRQLDDRDFKTRDAAERALAAVADRIALPLQEAIGRGAYSPEAGERLERLLSKARGGPPDTRREARCVEVLEYLRAKTLLERLAGGVPGAVLTREAREAVGRMG